MMDSNNIRRRVQKVSTETDVDQNDIRDGLLIDIPFTTQNLIEVVTGEALVRTSYGSEYFDENLGMHILTIPNGNSRAFWQFSISGHYTKNDFIEDHPYTSFAVMQRMNTFSGNCWFFTITDNISTSSPANTPMRTTLTTTNSIASNISLWANDGNAHSGTQIYPTAKQISQIDDIQIFLDGVNKGTDYLQNCYTNRFADNKVYVGVYNCPTSNVKLGIKHLRYYNRALSQEEILALHNLLV